jgi:type IV pilus assembly protein PilE
MSRSRGFTLIELMIAVAIIAVLAAIAIPSYSEYIRRSRVTEAISTLSGMRVKMEQYYQDNRKYDGACTVAPPATVANKPPDTVNWAFTCNPAPAGNNYVVIATGQGTMQGFQYTLNQDNARATAMTAPSPWPSNGACWVLKKDGSC